MTKQQEEKLSKIFEKNGAFWAFGNKQFDEQKKEGIKYVSMGAGLICPKENAETLFNEMQELTKAIQEENKKAIADKKARLTAEVLPKAERIHNRIILIDDAICRCNNYIDSCELVELAQEMNEKKDNESINRVVSFLKWESESNPEHAELYNENIQAIKELQAEILALA